MSMRNIERLIAEYDMLPEGQTILCAVSGGADSVCLLHWLATRGVPLAAAHFNHRLRGAESVRDEEFVVGLCRGLGVPLHLGGADVAAEAAGRRRGVEETARTLRYDFLQQTARETGAAAIATAHTADDNLETVLLHLTRGCGLRGLAGIPPRRGNLVRPLLETARSAVLDYLAECGVEYVEDSTNSDRSYSRNRIRAEVIPVLRELNPALTIHGARTIRILRGEDAVLDAVVSRWSWQTMPRAVELRGAALALRRAGQTVYARPHLEAVAGLLRGEASGGQVSLPGGVTARRAGMGLALHSGERPQPPRAIELPIPGTAVFGQWEMTASLALYDEKKIEKPDTFWLEYGKIVGRVVVRSRREGDRLRLPARRTRTLKKLYTDARIPLWEREGVPVLADEAGVLAVAGFGPREGALATPGERGVRIQIKRVEHGEEENG